MTEILPERLCLARSKQPSHVSLPCQLFAEGRVNIGGRGEYLPMFTEPKEWPWTVIFKTLGDSHMKRTVQIKGVDNKTSPFLAV